MSIKKIIPCLDLRDGKVVKGRRFKDIQEVDDPIRLAKRYDEQGADELVVYDITASNENKTIMLDIVSQIKRVTSMPLIVGGGINTIDHCKAVLDAGADKLSINTGAIRNPQLIKEASEKFGRDKIVLSVDVRSVDDVYFLYTNGGTKNTGVNAIKFLKRAEENGAGAVVVNSIDVDGVRKGYDISMLETVSNTIDLPIIASGGAGSMEDFYDIFSLGIDAGLAASIFHYGDVKIPTLKRYLSDRGIEVDIK